MDTHVILWWLTTPDKIHLKARKIIKDKSNIIYISSASFWEMAIKKSLGRLNLPHNLLETIALDGFKILPISPEECLGVADLPFIHADPFDRQLIIQAKLQDLVLITNDSIIPQYQVVTIKA